MSVEIVRVLGKPVAYWLDVDRRLKERGYDGLLDSFYEEIAALRLQLAGLDSYLNG
jgi:hypothetical protein